MTSNLGTGPAAIEPLDVQDRPDGPASAAIISVGIGACTLGFLAILAEANASFKALATLSEGVGSLSGKVVFTVIIWLTSWAGLHLAYRGKSFDIRKALVISLILMALGILTTIPPVFGSFAPAE